jgi:tetratricopeptide (TPR) repeat protein
MNIENRQGINPSGGKNDIHDNIFHFYNRSPRIILDHKPPEIDSFVGREQELQCIRDWMDDPSVRLIDITSTGGYGKTFLAAKTLEAAGGVPHRIWLSFEQPYPFRRVGQWLLQQFQIEIDEKTNDEDIAHEVVTQLSQQRCLLVLDNLETLLSKSGNLQESAYEKFLLRWLNDGSPSVILLTSRASFLLPDNQQKAVRSMQLKGLSSNAAQILLRQHSIEGEQVDLEQFLQLADGHPLLLDLTVGWLRNKRKNPVPNINCVLEKDDLYRFEQIVGEHRGDKEASLKKVLEYSVVQLDEPLQTLWQKLSVYRLPIELAAAQALQAEAQLEDLWKLARYSLLQEHEANGIWTFKFLPLLQNFARLNSGDQSDVHQRAIEYYCSIAKPSSEWKTIEDVVEYLENFHHYCELKQYDRAFNVLQETGCDSFLDRRGYNSIRVELYTLLETNWKYTNKEQDNFVEMLFCLSVAYRSTGQYPSAIKLHYRISELSQNSSDFDWKNLNFKEKDIGRVIQNFYRTIKNKNNLGITYYHQGLLKLAVESHQNALSIHREFTREFFKNLFHQFGIKIDDVFKNIDGLKADAFNGLGNIYKSLGEPENAISAYEQEAEIRHLIDDLIGEANALLSLAATYEALGRYQDAIRSYQRLFESFQRVNNYLGMAVYQNHIGSIYYRIGQYQEAIESHTKALQFSRNTSNIDNEPIQALQEQEARALYGLGNTYEKLDEDKCASENYQQAREIYQLINERTKEAWSLLGLSSIYGKLGLCSEAIENLKKAEELFKIAEDRAGEANASNRLGIFYDSQQQYSQAQESYQTAIQIYNEIGDLKATAIPLNNLGVIAIQEKQYDRAIALYQKSLKINKGTLPVEEAQTRFNLANAYDCLGQQHYEQKQYEKSIELFQQALNFLGTIKSQFRNDRQQFLDALKQASVQDELRTAYIVLGERSQVLGQYQEATKLFERMLKAMRDLQNCRGEADALLGLGKAYHAKGMYGNPDSPSQNSEIPTNASDAYHQALTIFQNIENRNIEDRIGEANVLLGLGKIYHALKQYKLAIDFFNKGGI